VLGDWIFHATKESFAVNIYQTDTLCTHKLPNRVQLLKDSTKLKLPGELIDYKMTLSEPDIATVLIDGKAV